MNIDFTNKRALVTGAAGGIGSALVAKLLECGATVLAWDNNTDELKSLKNKFPHIVVQCVDLLDWEATRTAAQECPHVDLLANVAGIVEPQPVGKIDAAGFDRIMGINARAIINLSQVIGERMKAAGNGGSIVNVSSHGSAHAFQGLLSYCVSKSAVDMITRCMALELGPHKIRVNSVNPSLVNTKMLGQDKPCARERIQGMIKNTPLGRMSEPEDVAHAILYLLSDKADMINGVHLKVDGGLTVH